MERKLKILWSKIMNDLDFILNFEENKIKGIWLSGTEGEGEFVRYWENGNLREHSHWENGKRHGEYKDYRENGQLMRHAFYENGKLNGKFKMYHNNGQLGLYCFYKNGKLNSECKVYHENGQL